MKVGDLVTLSSYGEARDFNNKIILAGRGQVGIIIKVNPRATYQYTVKWTKQFVPPTGHGYYRRAAPNHSRRELKYAKVKK